MARIFSAALSFMQPGLGQLYQGNFPKAVLFFAIFAAALFSSRGIVWVPFLVVASAADIYFLSHIAEKPRNTQREWLFAACGFIGFLSWVNLIYSF